MLNSGVSAIEKNEEGFLTKVFQQWEEAKQLLDGIVSSMMEGEKNEGLLIMVFQQQRRTLKQVLDGVVSAMKIMRKWQAGMFWGWGKK
jgi:putative heme degradation protein